MADTANSGDTTVRICKLEEHSADNNQQLAELAQSRIRNEARYAQELARLRAAGAKRGE